MMYPNPFMHTTTTGGGALACSAAIAAIHVTLRETVMGEGCGKGELSDLKIGEIGCAVSANL